MKRIRILSTDFDGTLVDYAQEPPVAPAFLHRLERLRCEGARWAVNTGRTLTHTLEGLADFPCEPDYLLTSEREVFRRTATGWEDFGHWNNRCREDHLHLFQQAGSLLDRVREFIRRHTRARTLLSPDGWDGIVATTEEEMDRVADYVDGLRPELPALNYQRNSVYLRFCHAAYDKGTALAELARLLEIPRDTIFAVGDNYNDLPMLDGRCASMVACPANSLDAVKQTVRAAGGYVAREGYSLGVAEALDFFADLLIEPGAIEAVA